VILLQVIQEGYENLKFRIGDTIDTLDNVFCKRYKDTVIQYVFQDDVLESIGVVFEINKMDKILLICSSEIAIAISLIC
jgi:hypothetical protein